MVQGIKCQMNLIVLPIKTKLASTAELELGTAQPQLVFIFFLLFFLISYFIFLFHIRFYR